MSARSQAVAVLYDAPGPRTRARHRMYSAMTLLVLAALVGLAGWRLTVKGQFDYDLWEVFVTPEYVRAVLVDGVLKTLQMAAAAIVLAVLLGLVLSSGKLSDRWWLRLPAFVVVEFFRAVPLLLLITFIFLTFGIGDGIGSYWSVVAGLALYNGTVLAEVFRAGVGAVPAGQAEAAYALGLRKGQVLRLVLLPQAVRIMLPAIVSQCVVALKDTSLGFYILAPGLTTVGKQVYGEFQNPLQTATVMAALYIVMNVGLTTLTHRLERRLGRQRPIRMPVGEASA